MRSATRCAAALAALMVAAGGAPGQRTLSAVAGVAYAEHRVDVGLGVERTAGLVIAAGAAFELSRLTVALQAASGALPAQTSGTLDRDVAQVSLDGAVRAVHWLELEAGVTLRAYANPVGRQRWVVVRTGAAARLPLTWRAASGVLRVGYAPVVSVTGLPGPDLALTAGAGMEYGLGPTRLRVMFDLERYDFRPAGVARRREQSTGVTVDLRVRLGRRP